MDRVTFTPTEFARLFGKSQSWGYRQIYSGKVKTITEYGRILIPASEVNKILATAGRYEGIKPKPPKSKEEFQQLKQELGHAWQKFLRQRREPSNPSAAPGKNTAPGSTRLRARPGSRKAAMRRLRRKD
jgi:hypothetical protein